jgi:hypothetical protein
MPLPYGHGKLFAVQGGPFDAFPGEGFGLCLEARSTKAGQATVALDVADFSTPEPDALDDALASLVDALYRGEAAYIGCMAGQGRTGLAMACLAREFGIADPVAHVRRYYTPRAVETDGQKRFVESVALPRTAAAVAAHRVPVSLSVAVVSPSASGSGETWRARVKRLKANLSWLRFG